MRLCLLFAVLVVLAPDALASGGKRAGAVSFHMETEEGGNPKMIFKHQIGGKERYFQRVPDIATNDIAAFSPFPSEDGITYGVAFKLTRRGAGRLSAVTAANKGRWVVATVAGRVVDGLVVDQQVDDGVLVIWQGVTLSEIKGLDKKCPRISELREKKKRWYNSD